MSDAPKTLTQPAEWSEMNAWQRNWLLGEIMKAEPLHAYCLRWKAVEIARLRVKDEAEGQSWLQIAKMSQDNWKRLMQEVPWTARDEVTIHVESWHIRYSDTPGGGWDVIEWLRKRGGVSVQSCALGGWVVCFDDQNPNHGMVKELAPTMAEAACRVALRITA